MSIADLLKDAGLEAKQGCVPSSAGTREYCGNKKALVKQCCTRIPAVPAQNNKVELQTKNEQNSTLLRLLELAERECVNVELVRQLSEPDLLACKGMDDEQLMAHLRQLEDDALRREGKLPASYNQRAICEHCGPVWLPQDELDSAADMLVINGWPTVSSCSWCGDEYHQGPLDIPRPLVEPCQCAWWKADTVNPLGGMGKCACDCHYPHQKVYCEQFKPALISRRHIGHGDTNNHLV